MYLARMIQQAAAHGLFNHRYSPFRLFTTPSRQESCFYETSD
jgi:hypothetical protein